MKKFLSFLLAAIMVMAMGTVVFAGEVDLGMTDNGTIDLSAYTEGTIKVTAYRYQKPWNIQELVSYDHGSDYKEIISILKESIALCNAKDLTKDITPILSKES